MTGNGIYMGAKAQISQLLLANAWSKTLDSVENTAPWPWMDAVPVAKISVPALDQSAIVLGEASGQALAFGPAHLNQTPLPGQPGISVIAAHKNTHFNFLKDLRKGDTISITRADGHHYSFIMSEAKIVHKDQSGIPQIAKAGSRAQIALVTCYPFDKISFGGPMRYVVYAALPEQLDLPYINLSALLT
jgi:sortase A